MSHVTAGSPDELLELDDELLELEEPPIITPEELLLELDDELLLELEEELLELDDELLELDEPPTLSLNDHMYSAIKSAQSISHVSKKFIFSAINCDKSSTVSAEYPTCFGSSGYVNALTSIAAPEATLLNVPFPLSEWQKLQFAANAALAAVKSCSPPDELLELEELLELPGLTITPELELEDELLEPEDEELLAPATSPELLELEEDDELPELELSGFSPPEDEPPGGTGLGPPLEHPCKARAPTVNRSRAMFFKVSLLYVFVLMTQFA